MPSTVSGALPIRRPAASAAASIGRRLVRGDRERLLQVDVLAGLQGPDGERGVDLRRRQVQQHVDRGVGQHVVQGTGRHPVLGRHPLGRRGDRVGDTDQAQVRQPRQTRQVLRGDVAAAHQRHRQRGRAHRLAHSSPRLTRVLTCGTSSTSTRCPGVQTKIRPAPHCRVQTAGEVTGRCHGIPLPYRLGGGGQHVDVVVAEHPVLLGDQVEVADPGRDRVVGGGRQHLDPVRHVVVGLLADPLVGVLAGVAGELTADQVQVVGGVAVGVGDPAVPAGEAGAGLDRRPQSRELLLLDGAHRHALHDQVGRGHPLGDRRTGRASRTRRPRSRSAPGTG